MNKKSKQSKKRKQSKERQRMILEENERMRLKQLESFYPMGKVITYHVIH